MTEWKEVRLGSLVRRKIGYGIVQPGASPEKGVPVIKANNIIAGLTSIDELDNTTQEIDSKYPRTKLNGGELIISLVGTVGKTAIVPSSFAGCNLVRATGLIDIEDPSLTKWVKYYIASSKGQYYINTNLNTTVQATLNVKSLAEMPIPIPPKREMGKMVDILSSLDDKIAVNRRICENLEAQAQALFKNWFVDFAPFKDGKFVESELGMIPEGWRVGRLEEMASVVGSGGTPKSSVKEYYIGDILWYGTGEFNDSFIYDSEKHISQEAIDNSSAKIFPIHTVLIAMYGATVGKLAILSNEASFNQAALGIVAADNIGFPFIYLTLLACRKQLIRLACGAAQQNLNAGTIKSHLTIIPNDNTMMSFNDLILPIFEKVECLQKESRRLATLRDTLLPKLMSGEIKI